MSESSNSNISNNNIQDQDEVDIFINSTSSLTYQKEMESLLSTNFSKRKQRES
jgi:hypothetical protein